MRIESAYVKRKVHILTGSHLLHLREGELVRLAITLVDIWLDGKVETCNDALSRYAATPSMQQYIASDLKVYKEVYKDTERGSSALR